MLRLGFHYHIPAMYKLGRIYTMGLLGRFIDSMADNCESIICFQHTPLRDEVPLMDYKICAKKVKFVDLGPHVSVPKRVLRFPQTEKIIRQHRESLDAMLIRGPSPLLPEIARAFRGLPTIFLIVGDNTLGLDDLPQPWWRKELIRVWSKWNKKRQIQAAKSNLTIVNSHKLYQELQSKLPNLIETRTTTLSQRDFFDRDDTCTKPPYHLLYAGRLDRAKGIFEMVEALDLLVKDGEDVVLDLVGWTAAGDTVVYETFALANSRGVKDRVCYHGYKSVGPELFAYYKAADIYWVASRVSEGFPRTIWEAMANSMPVIATRVGSIPDFIQNKAVLVEPSNPKELANAVKELIRTPSLRKQLISSGRDLSKENTLEVQTRKMIDDIENWVVQVSGMR